MENPTPEQLAVINHPRGKHARVLAVAGAGKTTTMVERIKYLVSDLNIQPSTICVLMFNRRARVQFKEKLDQRLPKEFQPNVHTFHSFSYSIIGEAVSRGLIPAAQNVWTGDKEELVRLHVHRAINELEKRGAIPTDSVDPDDALECIGLWKGSLIPYEHAGHRSNPLLPVVYKEFEKIRIASNAITFDDFVPLAVGILEGAPSMNRDYTDKYQIVIVDEYQDVNYGQQRLIEIIAGKRADVMVVGDDDQTIYEWRGARPDYIVHRYGEAFNNKPNVDYKLSRTFRFGPVLAQCAQNTISFNKNRIPKPLIAHAVAKEATIHILRDTSEQPTDVDKDMAQQVLTLVKQTGDPRQIVVLGRMFAQFTGLEGEFLAQGIPYRVIGRAPFFERREVVVLLDYLRLAVSLGDPLDDELSKLVASVANVPNRKLSKDVINKAAKVRVSHLDSVYEFIAYLTDERQSPYKSRQREEVEDLLAVLERLNERIEHEPSLTAGELLLWLTERIDYSEHFNNYYGVGETSEDRQKSVAAFCQYAAHTELTVLEFLSHIRKLDTTLGVPEDQQIVMTTIFRVKGEEFDYVFLPRSEEGTLPCLISTGNPVYDKRNIVTDPPPSQVIENERRLFYVAITRARKAVFIGTSSTPLQGSQEASTVVYPSRFLDEMKLAPTVQVMGELQSVAAGQNVGLADLSHAALKHAGHKPLIDNLLNHYLPLCGLSLPADISERLVTVPETTFSYSHPYGSPAVAKQKAETPQEKRWWED